MSAVAGSKGSSLDGATDGKSTRHGGPGSLHKEGAERARKTKSKHKSDSTPSTLLSVGGRKWGEEIPGLKQGKFSKTETDTVVAAVTRYAEDYNVPIKRLCEEGAHKGDLRGAWQQISQCLPDRTIQSIYRHGIRQLHGLKRGPWTDEEIEELKQKVEQYGKKWRTIEKCMGRSADTCRDKYRELVVTPRRGEWTQEEETMLVDLVRQGIHDPASAGQKGHEGTGMTWTEVADKIGSRNRAACMRKWDYIQGKQLERKLMRDGENRASVGLLLARAVQATGASHESEVTWTKLPYHLAGHRWKELRSGLPATMDLQEAASVVVSRLLRESMQEEWIEPSQRQAVAGKRKVELTAPATTLKIAPSPPKRSGFVENCERPGSAANVTGDRDDARADSPNQSEVRRTKKLKKRRRKEEGDAGVRVTRGNDLSRHAGRSSASATSGGDPSIAHEGGDSLKAGHDDKGPGSQQVSGSAGLALGTSPEARLGVGAGAGAGASSRRSKKLMLLVSRSLAEDD